MHTSRRHPFLHGRSLFVLGLALVALLAQPATLARPSLAATRKLSAITATNGTLQELKVAGDYVIYLADFDVTDRFDLYSTPVAGGPVTRLTASLPASHIERFEITPAGLVVFSTYTGTIQSGPRFLYSVPVMGGEPTLLGPTYPDPAPIHPGGSQLRFAVSPDGARVLYSADVASLGFRELFSVPAAGGGSLRLSPPLPDPLPPSFGPWVSDFQMSPDGGQVVFAVYESSAFASTLYVAPVLGGTAPLALATGTYFQFAISPDSSRVAFSDFDVLGGLGHTLRSVLLAGGTPADLATEGDPATFAFTADSQRVVFHTGASGGGPELIASVVAAGEQPPVEIASSDSGFGSNDVRFVLAPDGQSVFYTQGNTQGLLHKPVTEGAEATVHDSTFVDLSSLRFTADGQYALFCGFSYRDCYSSPLAGGASTLISEMLTEPVLLMPAGHGIVFSTREPSSPGSMGMVDVLYAASAAGGAPTLLARGLGPDRGAVLARGASSSGVVFFTSGFTPWNSTSTYWSDLYAAPFDGSTPPRLADEPRALTGDVERFEANAARGRAVYLADQETDGVIELYSAPIAGGPPVKLNLPGQHPWMFGISPLGDRVFFSSYSETWQQSQFSVPIGGGTATAIGAAGQFQLARFQFTPDGAQLIFSSHGGGLFRAPAAGGAPVLIDPDADPYTFLLSPDSARVVYQASSSIRSVRLDEGHTLILAQGRSPALTPDGATVIFERPSGTFAAPSELMAMPIDGGAPVVLLPEVEDLRIDGFSRDSARVIITTARSTGFSGTVDSLRSVALDGSGSVTLAEAEGPAGLLGRPITAQVVAERERVVYLARRTGGTIQVELASVALTGGASTVLFDVNGTATSVLAFVISPDGSQVLFLNDGELHRVATEGGSPEKLSAGVFGRAEFAEDGSTIFVEGGAIFQAAVGAARARVDNLPEGTAAEYIIPVGRSVVFAAKTGGDQGIYGTGTTELYAADIALAPPSGGFRASATNVAEGAGPAEVAVRLSRSSTLTTTVAFAVTGGTALRGVDYALGPGPLTFAPGETAKALPLTILDRAGFNGTRTIVLTLEAPTLSASAQAAPTTITVTIEDDEHGLFLPQLRR